jgi:glycosyltransferase involved in cell wall biosynthesis
VEQNATGLVVPPDDEKEFVAAAERLYQDATFRAQCGANALRYADEKFDIGKIAARFEEILYGTCAGGSPKKV